MSQSSGGQIITRTGYDAVLFDLDGVITDTASLHAACWKRMFDEYLQRRAAQAGGEFRPFDIATDYRLYVDGKPRVDGVRDFLGSRGILLPDGTPNDPPEAETVGGLGNRKNVLLSSAIEDIGVKPYDGSVRLIHQLRRQGFKVAIVTSSRNCDTVLRAAKLEALFDVRVDGNTIQAQHLAEAGAGHVPGCRKASGRGPGPCGRGRGRHLRGPGRIKREFRARDRCGAEGQCRGASAQRCAPGGQ
jgi:beta-phosphoglucomutase-like phosphatase (HAD superfamily)